MKPIVRYILIGLVALIPTCYIGYTIYSLTQEEETRRLEGIDVYIKSDAGVQTFMNEEDVLAEMTRSGLSPIGTRLDSIDLGYIEHALESNPIFSDAEVYIKPRSSRMRVEIQQREAVYMVQTPREQYYVTRERGTLPVNANYVVYVPVASGKIDKELATTRLYDLIETIERDEYFRHYFGHIYVDEQDGIILTPRIGRASVIMGHQGDWVWMLRKLRIFNEEVVRYRGWDTFEYIKLAYGRQVVAKEKEPRAPLPDKTIAPDSTATQPHTIRQQ